LPFLLRTKAGKLYASYEFVANIRKTLVLTKAKLFVVVSAKGKSDGSRKNATVFAPVFGRPCQNQLYCDFYL
jgi:hypothetical protein